MFATTLRPGILVSLSTSINGGADYQRLEIEPDHTTEAGARRARWETTREIRDPEDYARAIIARGKARSIITGVCCASKFGLLCPTEREADLDDALRRAREVVDAHNKAATSTNVEVYVMAGRVAQDDVEAARAISSEVRDLLAAMESGIEAANPEAIREAANKARAVGQMLAPAAQAKVSEAIQQARSAAREIVRRVEKAGETAADVVAELNVDKIRAGRFAFLDIEQDAQEPAHVEPAGRALDLPPDFDRLDAEPSAQAAALGQWDLDGPEAYAATLRVIELGE